MLTSTPPLAGKVELELTAEREAELAAAAAAAAAAESEAESIVWYETRQLVKLAIPTIVVQLGTTVPTAMTASCVGRYLDAEHLDGFTLANLTTNLLTLSLLSGLFTASDTLSPQAFGAGNFREVGLLAMRGFAGSIILIVPINTYLFFQMDHLLILCGQETIPAQLAQDWYRIYVFAVPFYALFSIAWKFLSSQEIMAPLVFTISLSTGIILPVSLETLVPAYGFQGAAFSMLIYYVSQVLLLFLYLSWKQPYKPETWPGLAMWREAMQIRPLLQYFQLGAGGMLATSEWWFWEVLALIIGTMGVIPLSVHTIPTQVLTVIFMISVGIGVALSIRIGILMSTNVKRAKQLAFWTSVVCIFLFATIETLTYVFRASIIRIFTTDPDVMEGADRIWWKVVLYCFALSIFGINMGIGYGLGMQFTVGYITTIVLWGVALPAIYIAAIRWDGGIEAAWGMLYPPYVGLNFILWYHLYTVDWDAIGDEIRKREGLDQQQQQQDFDTESTEQTLLL